MTHYNLVILGGGASGMMSARVAAHSRRQDPNYRILIIEKNPVVGKKLSISGGGRCNIMNAEFDTRELVAHYGDAANFLYSSFAQFGPDATWDYFHNNGLPLVVEDRKRAFPSTHSASDVVAFFEKSLRADNRITIMTGTTVKTIEHADNVIAAITTSRGETISADQFVLATGGVSHPETGSTGDGFTWLSDMGHTVVRPTPTLVPLLTRERWVADISGSSLDDTKITCCVDGVKAFVLRGRVLFTHTGLSGPLILNASKKVADLLRTGTVTMNMNLFPGMDAGSIDQLLISTFDNHKNKVVRNVLSEIVPIPKLTDVILDLAGIDFDYRVHSIPRELRKALGAVLLALPLTIKGLAGMDKAIVADGGIPLDEIDTRTFRSLRIENLYITGDLLHINRPSGGYSLQLCWTSGFVAGQSVSQ